MTPRMKTDHDDNATRISVFMPWGFHGDPHLMRLFDTLVPNVSHFVETGTEAGSTVAYVARMYPSIQCWTCEADQGTHELAKANTANLPTINHSHMHSDEWLQVVPVAPAIFWLDAHSHGWGCSLGQEINAILERWGSGYIFMDDFQVPERDDLGFDWYSTYGKLNWETVANDIAPEQMAKVKERFYPGYPGFVTARGWMLLTFGDVPEVGDIEGVEMVRG